MLQTFCDHMESCSQLMIGGVCPFQIVGFKYKHLDSDDLRTIYKSHGKHSYHLLLPLHSKERNSKTQRNKWWWSYYVIDYLWSHGNLFLINDWRCLSLPNCRIKVYASWFQCFERTGTKKHGKCHYTRRKEAKRQKETYGGKTIMLKTICDHMKVVLN